MGTCWREQVDEGLGQREERSGYGRGVPCGCCGECVVVVVRVVSIFFVDYRTFYVWVAVTHGLIDTERTHAIYLIM